MEADIVMAVAACISLPLSGWAIYVAMSAAKNDRINALLSLRQYYQERFNAMQGLTNTTVPSLKETAQKDGFDALDKIREVENTLKDLHKSLTK